MAEVTVQIVFTRQVDIPADADVKAVAAILTEEIRSVDVTLDELKAHFGPVSINAHTATDSVSEEFA